MEVEYESLVEYLRDEVGEKLRAVGRYDEDGYEILHIRDDVAQEFSEADIEQIHHEMVLKGLGNQHIESLFNDEPLNCAIYQFASSVRLHFVHEDYRGVYVSIDYDGDINPSRIAERCRDLVG